MGEMVPISHVECLVFLLDFFHSLDMQVNTYLDFNMIRMLVHDHKLNLKDNNIRNS